MDDLKQGSIGNFQLLTQLEKKIVSFSASDVKKPVPRINFKKIKLNKFNELYTHFEKRQITQILLDDELLKSNLPIRKTTLEVGSELSSNPLRKKVDDEEKLPVFEPQITRPRDLMSSRSQECIDDGAKGREGDGVMEDKQDPKASAEEKKDITFSLEAQVVHEDENIIFSPGVVSLPPFKEDILSSSGKQEIFIWPPSEEERGKGKGEKGRREKGEEERKKRKEISKKTKAKKIKPYFISEEKGLEEEEQQKTKKEEQRGEETKQEEAKEIPFIEKTQAFPWLTHKDYYEDFESIFQGGLESTLLDVPPIVESNPANLEQKPLVEKETKIRAKDDLKQLMLKPKQPEQTEQLEHLTVTIAAIQSPSALNEEEYKTIDFRNITIDTTDKNGIKLGYSIELLGKVKKMFGKFGRVSPLRIMIFGGLVVTVGYLFWVYLFPDLKIYLDNKQDKDLVVKKLFKEKYLYKKKIDLKKEKKETNELKEGFFKPISEEERLALIQKAREALESRVDPFGQEDVLPLSKIEERIKEQEEDKTPKEIQLERKQIELIGVISTKSSNLALVNLYTASYSVSPEDTKEVREMKLKTTLSMTVPNRIELSLLDPLEGWIVKQIQKSKSRSEDPIVELAKGSQKFKLKVGQRVLLPDDKQSEEDAAEED